MPSFESAGAAGLGGRGGTGAGGLARHALPAVRRGRDSQRRILPAVRLLVRAGTPGARRRRPMAQLTRAERATIPPSTRRPRRRQPQRATLTGDGFGHRLPSWPFSSCWPSSNSASTMSAGGCAIRRTRARSLPGRRSSTSTRPATTTAASSAGNRPRSAWSAGTASGGIRAPTRGGGRPSDGDGDAGDAPVDRRAAAYPAGDDGGHAPHVPGPAPRGVVVGVPRAAGTGGIHEAGRRHGAVRRTTRNRRIQPRAWGTRRRCGRSVVGCTPRQNMERIRDPGPRNVTPS